MVKYQTNRTIEHYVSELKHCASVRDLEQGKKIHREILSGALDGDRYLANLVVDMYGSCGSVEDALSVFNGIVDKNSFSWTLMLRAYAQNGHYVNALELFSQILLNGMRPDAFVLSTVLAVCCSSSRSTSVLFRGREIHREIIGIGAETNVVLGNCLVNFYSWCGEFDLATIVFDRMEERDCISWNTMIAAYGHCGRYWRAIRMFFEMQQEGVNPSEKTLVSVLGACSIVRAVDVGRKIHQVIVVNAGFSAFLHVANSLVSFYGKCGRLEEAKIVLDSMEQRTVSSWNAMITSYAQNGHSREALELFERMDVEQNDVTFLGVLTACTRQNDVKEGERIHRLITEKGLDRQVVIGNSLVNMYAKNGKLDAARAAFDRILDKDVISWNAIIAGHAQHGYAREALELFHRMDLEGIKADTSTLTSVVDACTLMEELLQGTTIHSRFRLSNLVPDQVFDTALINLYGKCGRIGAAVEIFKSIDEEHKTKDIVAWNAMAVAFAHNGHTQEVLQLFWNLCLSGFWPDHITFVALLFSCSHAGLFEDGCKFFASLEMDYGVSPTRVHYMCMVDLLSRSGHLLHAEGLIESFPCGSAEAWMALLASSKLHKDLELGVRAAKKALAAMPQKSSLYAVLSAL